MLPRRALVASGAVLVVSCRAEPAVVVAAAASPHAVDVAGPPSPAVPSASSVPAPSAPLPSVEAPAPPSTDAGTRDLVLLDSEGFGSLPKELDSKLSPAAEKRVIDRVFPGKHLASLAECDALAPELVNDPTPDPDGSRMLALERKAGMVAPHVEQLARGAFTAPHTSQVLYVISTMECGVGVSNGWGTTTVAVLEGDKVVARTLEPGNTRIAAMIDVDEDGRDEVLLVQGFYWGGVGGMSGKLDRIEATHVVPVHDFGEIAKTDCGGVNVSTHYSVLYVRPARGGAATYSTEKKVVACDPL
jgi:hypothetical protein